MDKLVRMDIEEQITKIIEASKITDLYQKMKWREGKFAIFKGQSKRPDYLFIGEAAGREEDKAGIPFIGRSGKVLDGWIEITKSKQTAVMNVVPIMPEKLNKKGKIGIRKPTKQEIKYFRPLALEMIKTIEPTKIILLGRSAEESITNGTIKMKESTWYGRVGYIHHPSYYIRRGQNGNKEFKRLMENERK